MTQTSVEKFDEWALVEVMGHKQFAGRVTEQSFGGASFVRVDVPEVRDDVGRVLFPSFTKLFGAASIYCISPCTEETARAFAAKMQSESFSRYEAPRLPASPVREMTSSDFEDEADYELGSPEF